MITLHEVNLQYFAGLVPEDIEGTQKLTIFP